MLLDGLTKHHQGVRVPVGPRNAGADMANTPKLERHKHEFEMKKIDHLVGLLGPSDNQTQAWAFLLHNHASIRFSDYLKISFLSELFAETNLPNA